MHPALMIVAAVLVAAWMAEMFWAAAEDDSMVGFFAAIGTCLLIVVTITAFSLTN